MKRVLITGASSYLGYKLAQQLALLNVDIHAIVRASTDMSRIAKEIPNANRHCHDGTIASMAEIVDKAAPEAVFHLAGTYIPNPTPSQIEPLITSNYLFGIQMLESLRNINAKAKIISAGTYSQYYQSETPNPLNLYSSTKQAFQDALSMYADKDGFEVVQLILYDSYGIDDWRFKLLQAIVKAARDNTELALPDEDVSIDLTHIADVAAAFVVAAELLERDRQSVDRKVFSVGYGETYRLSDIVELFQRVSGQRIRKKIGSYTLPARRISVPWRGPRLPQWTPKISLEQGLKEFADAFL